MSDCCLTPAAAVDPAFRESRSVLRRKCDVTGFSASSPSPPASSSSSCSRRGSLNRPKAIGLQRFRFSFIQDGFSDCPMSDKPSHSQQQQQQRQQPKLLECSQSTSDKTFDRSSAVSCHQSMTCSSASLPCLPASSTSGHLTNILPFLFLGSQHDALAEDVIKSNGITHVLNVSLTSPRCPFVPEVNFLRIPVDDSYTDRILPHFQRAFQFLDDARGSSGCALVHCLAGISRSPTMVIAYVMRSMQMTSEEAYSFVKGKRPSISPNFNFLGQLLEFETSCQQKSKGKHAGKNRIHDDEQDSIGSGSAQETKTRRTSDWTSPDAETGPGSSSSDLNGFHSSATTRSAFDDDDNEEEEEEEEAGNRHRLKFPLNWESHFTHLPTESIDHLPFTPCFALFPDEDRGQKDRRDAVGPPQPAEPHETKAKPVRLRRHPPAPRPRPPSTIAAVQFGLRSIKWSLKSSLKTSIFKRTDHHNKPVLLMD